ncbi:glycoside hydrolase family 88 protein [Rhizobium sp. RM]|uniref:glycoside hydrolase family 88/105 protein n=1 Tax=Rhizobium sp. RM TaxID=2748079 RepID=UPI00110F51AA|nr:glycoside hydrolase family 88 protein [Rhizobium sp. RM]NWJ27156.1 glycoside hydrolase family 88 protein [Rhizobium sp. RM]TMV20220.1 di-trans,poly-cis-decaprenylcistransferase [Rhizobium sp. Td3]
MKPTDYFDKFANRYQHYKGGSWCYEDGCVYRGLQFLADATGEARWKNHLHRLADAQIAEDGKLAGYSPEEFNIDHILAGRVLFPLAEETKDPRYLAAADHLAGQLANHPRIRSGNYWHKKRYPHQVWLDGLYMGLPFQIEYAQATGRPELIVDALQQFSTALALTANPAGLYVHGYDESRDQRWADPITGHSPALWARAVGWLSMALVDVLAILPDDTGTASLRKRTRHLLADIVARQTSNGLWMQVLDAPDLVGNYEETSASAMFSYALLRAARLNLVDGDEAKAVIVAGRRALDALLDTKLVQDEDGITRLSGIVHVAGLGGFEGNYRSGTPEYYLTEPVVSDDAKGVGPLMMAYAESLRLR